MRPSSILAVLAAAILLATPDARAGECKVDVGPNDRVARGESLVIRPGEQVENAVVLQGDLTIESGATVEKAVAVGGTVTVRSGGRVKQDAVALGGDVVVEADGRVGNDAVSLGGQVQESPGSRIQGSVVGLAFQGGKSSLAKQILKGITSIQGCNIELKGATGGHDAITIRRP
jgi:UDP-3-O-[3-hydroxymyristoyl] glucosamine N-acyltransferase